MGEFADKIAIVTGAGRGLGEAVTRKLVAGGATVLAVGPGRNEGALADELGPAVVPVTCDVGREEDVDSLFALCREHFGRLDLLLNNAGISKGGRRLHETPVSDWDMVMDVNLRGAFMILRQAIALMLESGGGAIRFSPKCPILKKSRLSIALPASNWLDTLAVTLGFPQNLDPAKEVDFAEAAKDEVRGWMAVQRKAPVHFAASAPN